MPGQQHMPATAQQGTSAPAPAPRTPDFGSNASRQGRFVEVTGTMNVRSSPEMGDNIVDLVETGAVVRVLGEQGGWLRVAIEGQQGETWIGSRHTRPAEAVGGGTPTLDAAADQGLSTAAGSGAGVDLAGLADLRDRLFESTGPGLLDGASEADRRHHEGREDRDAWGTRTEEIDGDEHRTRAVDVLSGITFEHNLPDMDVDRTAEFQLPLGLVASAGVGFELGGGVAAGVGWDGGIDISGLRASGSVEAFALAQGSVAASGSVGLGVGMANVAGVGVAGELTVSADLMAQAGIAGQGSVDLSGGNDHQVSATGGIALEATLNGSVSINPYVTILGERFEYEVPIASHDFIVWRPSLDVTLDNRSGVTFNGWDDTDQVEFIIPDFIQEGPIGELFDAITRDNRAHEAVQDMKETGLLDTLTPMEKGKLFSDISDWCTLHAHQDSLLELLESTSDVDERIELLHHAYFAEHDDWASSNREAIAWARENFDGFFGGDTEHTDEFDELLGRA